MQFIALPLARFFQFHSSKGFYQFILSHLIRVHIGDATEDVILRHA
jgi:hypothetical protein